MNYESIFKQIQRGGTSANRAADELFTALGAKLMAFFRRVGATDDQAEEATFVGLGKLIEAIKAGPNTHAPAGWSWRVAQNAGRDFLRVARRDALREVVLHSEDDDSNVGSVINDFADNVHIDPLTTVCLKQQWERFWRENPDYANALERSTVDQWLNADIAEAMNRAVHAVDEMLSQARKRLYRLFMHCISDDEKWK